MPTRLRMKRDDVQEDVLEAARKARKRSKRHHTEHGSRYREESLSPPRNASSSTRENTHGPVYDDPDFDESSIPPEQARKRAHIDENNNDEDQRERFERNLAAADWDDRGIGAHEDYMYSRQMPSTGFAYGGAAGIAMGRDPNRPAWFDEMDEDEYAEYVRAGMWFRKNKDLVEAQERREKAAREQQEKEERERRQLEREEKRRIRRLEEEAKARRNEDSKLARATYENKWKQLLALGKAQTTESDDATHRPLRFTDFAWPVYPHFPLPPLSWPAPSDLSTSSISNFLFAHLAEADTAGRKAILRAAVLQYHPDRFERLVNRLEDNNELRTRVRELGLRTSQILNELNASSQP